MLNATIQLIMFFIIAIGAISIFYFFGGINKMNILIFTTLFLLWFVMYFYKAIPEYQTNINKLGFWVWPIILSIYQFTQAATRLPIGIISQKINSRKKIIQFVGLLLLLAITLLIASKMAVWAIVIAAIIGGVFGATFGLDAQYVSENWDIKQVFRSSVIVFIIPVMAKMLSQSVVGYTTVANIKNVWIYLLAGAMTIGTITVVAYSFSKEDVSTIKLDNMDGSKVSMKNRGKADIAVISITGALLAFMYTFVMSFGTFFNIGIWASGFEFVSLLSSTLVALLLIKIVKPGCLKRISMALMIVSFIVIGITGITGSLDKATWITASVIASVGFGSYLMVLFGSALHFDHKYPVLVIGIFLSVKSFMTAVAQLSSGEMIINMPGSTLKWIGIYTLIASGVSLVLMEITSVYFFKKKDNKTNKLEYLVNDMVSYEKENSNKIVISNKK